MATTRRAQAEDQDAWTYLHIPIGRPRDEVLAVEIGSTREITLNLARQAIAQHFDQRDRVIEVILPVVRGIFERQGKDIVSMNTLVSAIRANAAGASHLRVVDALLAAGLRKADNGKGMMLPPEPRKKRTA